jgi:hypothetical protein
MLLLILSLLLDMLFFVGTVSVLLGFMRQWSELSASVLENFGSSPVLSTLRTFIDPLIILRFFLNIQSLVSGSRL